MVCPAAGVGNTAVKAIDSCKRIYNVLGGDPTESESTEAKSAARARYQQTRHLPVSQAGPAQTADGLGRGPFNGGWCWAALYLWARPVCRPLPRNAQRRVRVRVCGDRRRRRDREILFPFWTFASHSTTILQLVHCTIVQRDQRLLSLAMDVSIPAFTERRPLSPRSRLSCSPVETPAPYLTAGRLQPARHTPRIPQCC